MRLRYLFIITFCLVALVPLALFWKWPYSKVLDYELEEVKEHHLVIAKNLAGAFERYHQDVTGLFAILNPNTDNSKLFDLFVSYNFQSIMLVSKQGEIKGCIFNDKDKCPTKINKNLLSLVEKNINKNKVTISTVTEDKSVNTGPILLVLKPYGNDYLVGYLSTKYIVTMGKKVSFGKKGHAAIVDQEGNFMAHPFDSWIVQRKNISKLSVVKKMISGQTGVEIFYSPALKDDMISGYTSVSNAKWGVMVPQPLYELKNKAEEINTAALFIIFLALGLALLITVPLSFLLIKPLERLSDLIKSIEKGKVDTKVELAVSNYLPSEIKELKNGFVKMMDKIEENKKHISQLAYIDVHTNLPNRNYFHKLMDKVLLQLEQENQKAALVFIDFDGFKGVNDTYGHRAGDELLTLFARRIIEHFSLGCKFEKSCQCDSSELPGIIPARLGGDEFVILFRNIKNIDSVKDEIQSLFDDVFTHYDLYGGVKLKLTGSAGVAIFPKDGQTYSKLLKSADTAMYDAKKAGKNTIRFFETK